MSEGSPDLLVLRGAAIEKLHEKCPESTTVDTLHALKSDDGITDAWFAIRGANLNLDDNGNVESVLDAAMALEIYVTRCREEGHPVPNVIGMRLPVLPRASKSS